MNKNIMDFNKDQRYHERMVADLVNGFTFGLMMSAIDHDRTKWSEEEYETFVNARSTLNASTDGKDEEYTKACKTKAIQNHVNKNRHHPEYWQDKGKMPLSEIIIMFFDWYSRSIQRGNSIDDFWDYNIKKLKDTGQGHAITIVELLRDEVRANNLIIRENLTLNK